MSLIKKPWVIFTAIIVIAALFGGYYYFLKPKPAPVYLTVRRGDIAQTVTVTGALTPIDSVNLAFEVSGKINSVNVDVGSRVSAGDPLATLDDSDLQAQLAKAKADLATQQADLDKSNVLLASYYSNNLNILNDSFAKAGDAVYSQADSMFSNAQTNNPQLSFSTNDSQAATDSRNDRFLVGTELAQWRSEIDQLNPSSQDASYQELAKSQTYLSDIKNLLLRVSDALNQAINTSQSTVNTYKTAISTGRSEVNTAQSNITSQIQTIDSQKATIASDEASVQSYQASIDNVRAQIAKTVLYAPIGGVVTVEDAKVGQIANPSTNLISIISASKLEIDVDVPEADIGKVTVDNPVSITFDAFPNENFTGKVHYIDPAETVISGVVNYLVKIYLDNFDSRLKSGLTANLNIQTIKKSGVLILPEYGILETDQGTFAQKVTGKTVQRVPVKIGIRSQDGNVEIVSGLSEGDEVLNIAVKTQ